MEQIPNIWRDLKLEFKDNVQKQELRKSLLEEEKVDEHNIIRTDSQKENPQPLDENKKKQRKLSLIVSHCIIS